MFVSSAHPPTHSPTLGILSPFVTFTASVSKFTRGTVVHDEKVAGVKNKQKKFAASHNRTVETLEVDRNNYRLLTHLRA